MYISIVSLFRDRAQAGIAQAGLARSWCEKQGLLITTKTLRHKVLKSMKFVVWCSLPRAICGVVVSASRPSVTLQA
ncbi:MAG TPA: hypothetical protein VMT91_07975 [Anaerolineales bacterium]|nr:hypothetical protein [Anaerolineales bacterium]